jgi:DtxR family transcriptional regulator, Mn-dependent transcriptional regulator
MKDSIHVSKENYLKAILEAEAEGRQVIPAMLAHWLEVSAPAVTMALKRLKRDGCVKVGADGIVRLTAAGREMAYHTALRHHLIERMLSEVFGMEWHEIHEEAERLEHAVSPAFEAKLKEKLGEGGACPHGNAVLPRIPAERKRAARCSSPRPPRASATPSSASRSAIPSCSSFCTPPASAPARACAS